MDVKLFLAKSCDKGKQSVIIPIFADNLRQRELMNCRDPLKESLVKAITGTQEFLGLLLCCMWYPLGHIAETWGTLGW